MCVASLIGQTLKFINSLPRTNGFPFSERFPNVDPVGKRKPSQTVAIDLLEKMLVWDPHVRVSASEALSHPYLSGYHDPDDEPDADFLFDWSLIDVQRSVQDWKARISEVGFKRH